MNQRAKAKPATIRPPKSVNFFADAAPAIGGILSVLIAYTFQKQLFADLNFYPLTLLLFIWLFGAMVWCAFSVMRHAEALAEKLGEPYGTLVLTLSVIIIEVALIASVMLHGENNPTLARDAMFATLMIVLNGMIGAALIMGAIRYWEQDYNLAGARAFLAVIASLAVFALILPNHVKTEPDPSQAPYKTLMFAGITILFYIVFIIIQTMRHRAFFAEPGGEEVHSGPEHHASGSLGYHLAMLLVTLAIVVALAEYLAILVDFGIEDLQLPDASAACWSRSWCCRRRA